MAPAGAAANGAGAKASGVRWSAIAAVAVRAVSRRSAIDVGGALWGAAVTIDVEHSIRVGRGIAIEHCDQ